MSATQPVETARSTPLTDLNVEMGGRMVDFAGYAMPVQYKAGILAEHKHTRAAASLFDVSHMGQARLSGGDCIAVLDALTVGAFAELPVGRQRYTLLMADSGGIVDDMMVCRRADHFFLVVNASRKAVDFAEIEAACAGRDAKLEVMDDRALIALQGPKAVDALARHAPGCAEMTFMDGRDLAVDGVDCFVTRSGYTGEDGFEISCPADAAEAMARALLAEPEVEPAGLGARDSLRLEAGLCLYGNDIDETTTPVEAGLVWTIPKVRRERGCYRGADMVAKQLRDGPARKRVGVKILDKAPARPHTEVRDETGETVVGEVTSGGPSPSLGHPIAMAYVATSHAAIGTRLSLMVRGRALAGEVVAMPFVPQRYVKGNG